MLHKVQFIVGDEPLFVWVTPDGDALLLGSLTECAEIAQAIQAAVNGAPVAVISEYDAALTPIYSVEEAITEAQAFGHVADPARFGQAVRAAARRGAIRGAMQVDGRWQLPRRTFRWWLQSHQAETRGRPARA